MAVGEPHKPVEHKLTADEVGMHPLTTQLPGSRLDMSAHPTDFKWSEAEHPRADNGRFGDGGGAGKKPSGDKAPDTIIVYHGTTDQIKAKIKKEGIRPAKQTERLYGDFHYQGQRGNAAYVTKDKWVAETWARQAVNAMTGLWFEKTYSRDVRVAMKLEKAVRLQEEFKAKHKIMVVECIIPKAQLNADSHSPSTSSYFIVGGISPKQIKKFNVGEAKANEEIITVYIPVIVKAED